MFPLPIGWTLVIALVSSMAIGSVAFYEGYHYEDISYQAALAKQKSEGDAELLSAQKRADQIQESYDNLNAKVEQDNASSQLQIQSDYDKNQDLLNTLTTPILLDTSIPVDSLRRTTSGTISDRTNLPSKPSTTSSAATTSSTVTIPKSTLSALFKSAETVDSVSAYANACYEWVNNINKVDVISPDAKK
jgi:hypothetical protein